MAENGSESEQRRGEKQEAAVAVAVAEQAGGEQQATREGEARRGSKATSTLACSPDAIAGSEDR
jgi:hypothetical protein